MSHTLEVLVANCLITFNVIFSPEQGLLEIGYTFENRTAQYAIVFNLLNEPHQHPAMADPSRVAIWPDNGHLDISKMAFPAPPLMSVESLYIPMATMIAPGQSFSETVRIGIPFKLWHPYFQRNMLADDDLARLDDIRFRLGFIIAAPAYIETLKVTELSDRRIVSVPAFTPGDQHFAEFSLPVDGLARLIAPR